MRKLSQKAWNNVLIFSMLTLIVIFNWEKVFGVSQNNERDIVPQGAVVLSLQIDQLTFERVGTAWRVNGPADLIPEELGSERIAQILAKWREAVIKVPEEEIDKATLFPLDHVVKISMAGELEEQVYSFKTVGDTTYVIYDAHYFLLQEVTLQDLLP